MRPLALGSDLGQKKATPMNYSETKINVNEYETEQYEQWK
jgi:hypothetical protein